jgi:hypothetical protein
MKKALFGMIFLFTMLSSIGYAWRVEVGYGPRYHERVYVGSPWYHPHYTYWHEGYYYPHYYRGHPYYYYDPRFYWVP